MDNLKVFPLILNVNFLLHCSQIFIIVEIECTPRCLTDYSVTLSSTLL